MTDLTAAQNFKNSMIIRLETPADFSAVERLTYRAFQTMTYPDGSRDPYVSEHYLIHVMRGSPAFLPELDFVGEIDGEIVAHIAYTRSKVVRPDGSELETITFGPVSVKAELHGKRLGTEIIQYSLNQARELGYGAVLITGHPSYYPRFGFRRAGDFGITPPDPTGIFDGAFMALELIPGYLGVVGGIWYEDEVFHIDESACKAFRLKNNLITYRQATKADINTVTALLCKLYGDHHTTEELLTENEAHFANPTQAFFLAFDGSLAVGVTHASVRREYVEGSLGDVCGYLEAVYTEPAYRNQGVARRLVAECEAWATENGCTMFASDCELDNTDSEKFHLSIGFEEVNRSIHFAKMLGD